MSWTESRIFREWPRQMFQVSGTGYTGLDSDTVKVALFNNSGTPDSNAVVTSTGYNTGAWVTTNEISAASEWTAGGRTLASKTFGTPAAGTANFDAADLTGSATISLSNVYGCLVYDDSITGGTVVDQGVCYIYFGGVQGVVSGTFSVVWHPNGICDFTM